MWCLLALVPSVPLVVTFCVLLSLFALHIHKLAHLCGVLLPIHRNVLALRVDDNLDLEGELCVGILGELAPATPAIPPVPAAPAAPAALAAPPSLADLGATLADAFVCHRRNTRQFTPCCVSYVGF